MTAETPSPFSLGERFEETLTLGADEVRAFADQVGDTSPVHHDAALARELGFGGLIASGAHTAALMTAFTAALITKKSPSLGLEVQFRFHKPVKADEPLTICWEVKAIEPKPKLGGHVITFAGRLTDAAGVVGVSGQVKALVFNDWSRVLKR